VAEFADHPDERFLHEILRLRSIACEQVGEPAGRRGVPLVQLGEIAPPANRLDRRLRALHGLAHRLHIKDEQRAFEVAERIAAACWYHPSPMEQKLVAEKREGTGKGAARKLRASGRVPAILYGHGMDPLSLSVDSRELFHLLHTGAGANVLVGIVVDGTEHLALPREVQRDHIRGRFVHIDFLAVRRDEKIHVTVPLKVVGESPGVKAGGVLEHHLWELSVECLATDVPEAIEVDISQMEIGSSFRVSDLRAPSGSTILTNPEDSVVAVTQPQMAVEAEEEAAEAVEGEAAEEEAEGATAEEAENAAEQSEE
jgi:large subunit ribosomal protein L25